MRGKPDCALAARLRELKNVAEPSYQDIADAIGVSKSAVHQYLTGKIHIPAERLPLFARAFGCPQRYTRMRPGAPLPKRKRRAR